MKTHHIIIIALAAFLTSCSTPNTVVESDSGKVYPASHLDNLRGMVSGKRDAEMMAFADHLIREGGTVKVLRWTHRGQAKYTAMRLVKCVDGTEFWQGPTPPSGFYAADLEEQIFTTP